MSLHRACRRSAGLRKPKPCCLRRDQPTVALYPPTSHPSSCSPQTLLQHRKGSQCGETSGSVVPGPERGASEFGPHFIVHYLLIGAPLGDFQIPLFRVRLKLSAAPPSPGLQSSESKAARQRIFAW